MSKFEVNEIIPIICIILYLIGGCVLSKYLSEKWSNQPDNASVSHTDCCCCDCYADTINCSACENEWPN